MKTGESYGRITLHLIETFKGRPTSLSEARGLRLSSATRVEATQCIGYRVTNIREELGCYKLTPLRSGSN